MCCVILLLADKRLSNVSVVLTVSSIVLIYVDVNKRYDSIVTTKKELVTEFEDIMDTKSRNYYDIQNKKLNLQNKEKMYSWEKAEEDLEQKIAKDKKARAEAAKLNSLSLKRGSIKLGTEELDNWSFDDWNSV